MDLSRFHETFFQESLEGLSVMESGLLNLARAVDNNGDPELIHTIFRAAHSMKGASATFGFEDIAQFTHLLETLLGLMRDGEPLPQDLNTDVLLSGVDWLRELVSARLEQRQVDQTRMSQATADLEAVLASPRLDSSEAAAPTTPPSTNDSQPNLQILFTPHRHLFLSGNDPLLYIVELANLGELSAAVDVSRLPQLSELNTEHCFLGWDLSLLQTPNSATDIRGVFDWIEGDCELEIHPLRLRPVQPSKRPPPAPSVDPAPQLAKSEAPRTGPSSGAISTLRVATDKVDSLVNLVGELVITQSMLSCIGEEFQPGHLTKLREGLAQLSRNTRELQEMVLKIRMLPISNLFDRFPRVVHDLGHKLGKAARLTTSGEQTELDKTVLEKLSDPLLHLVRNSMDHGLERPEARRDFGKPDEGTIHLHAEHRGGNILIEISDDGCGLHEGRILARARQRGLIKDTDTLTSAQTFALIFEPGFSTVDQVTDLSGRGVGMDVVRRNVEELGGRIELTSATGYGTKTTIELPLTLAIMEGQLLRVGNHRFVLPLISIIESLKVDRKSLLQISEGIEVYRLRGEYLRVLHLETIFKFDGDPVTHHDELLVVIESRGKRIALRVDDLLAQQQVVIKSLETNFGRVEGIAGATILGDGSVALILDIAGVMERSKATALLGPNGVENPEWSPQ